MDTPQRPGPLSIALRAVLLTGLLAQAACQSTGRPADEPRGNIDEPVVLAGLPDAARSRVQALAAFASAQVYELDQQFDRALDAYETALRLDPDQLDLHRRIALNLILLDRADEAEARLTDLVERHPDRAEPLLWLGSIYRHQQDRDRARESFEAALELDPENAGIYLQLVELKMHQGRVDEAIALLDTGVEQAVEPLPLYRLLAELLLRQAQQATDPVQRAAVEARAIGALESAYQLAPREIVLARTLGEIHLQRGRTAEAIPYLEKAHQLEPDNPQLKLQLAQAYEISGRLKDAARMLELLVAAQPSPADQVPYLLALGGLQEQLGNIEQAVEHYRRVTRIGAPDAALYLKLAYLQMEKQPDEAVQALEDGLAALPGNPNLWEMLGYLRFNEQHYQAADEAFKRAQALWPAAGEGRTAISASFWLYAALARYYTGQPDDIAPLLQAAMEEFPETLGAFIHNAFLDENRERVATVVPVFERLLEKEPGHVQLHLWLGYVHSFLEQHDVALQYFDRYHAQAAGRDDQDELLDARFYFWYAAAHEREGLHERAEELFKKCMELDPAHAEAHNYLAYMWAEKGVNLDEAETYIQVALEQHPDSAAFIDTLGWVYYQQGRYEQAYAEIRRANEIMPDDPTIREHLGDVYWKLEQPEEALDQWKRAFAINPDNEDVARKLTDAGVDLAPFLPAPEEEETAPEHEASEDPPPPEEPALEADPDESGETPETVPSQDEAAGTADPVEPPAN